MTIKVIGKIESKKPFQLPFYEEGVFAGFPSSADDYLENQLDLHELLIKHPAATFFVRVEGDSMIGAGMQSGDILIVDRSLTPQSGKIIVALLNREFTVKRFVMKGKKIYLHPENPRYPMMEVDQSADFQVWGVVTYVIHRAR